MSIKSVIDTARGELGYTETPPGSNRTKYWDDFDKTWQGQPWCVAFLWWCFQHAGEGQAFFGGAKTASCGTLLRWYREQGLTVPVDEIQAGDLVFYNFHGGQAPEHIGIVDTVAHGQTGSVQGCITIEGNTTCKEGGSQDNGGCVCIKTRYRSQIVGAARPKYKEDEMAKKTDYDDHWAAPYIRWAIMEGLLKGYPDGSFQPDKPVTRAEMAVILHRIYSRPKEDK